MRAWTQCPHAGLCTLLLLGLAASQECPGYNAKLKQNFDRYTFMVEVPEALFPMATADGNGFDGNVFAMLGDLSESIVVNRCVLCRLLAPSPHTEEKCPGGLVRRPGPLLWCQSCGPVPYVILRLVGAACLAGLPPLAASAQSPTCSLRSQLTWGWPLWQK